MAVIIQQTPWLFDAIRYLGAAFLVWLGYQALTSHPDQTLVASEKASIRLRQSFSEGLMISFLNPKLAIFFLALFSQFVVDEASVLQSLIMIATVTGIDTLWYCLVALVLSHSLMLPKLRRHIGVIEKASGVVLLLVALRVVI